MWKHKSKSVGKGWYLQVFITCILNVISYNPFCIAIQFCTASGLIFLKMSSDGAALVSTHRIHLLNGSKAAQHNKRIWTLIAVMSNPDYCIHWCDFAADSNSSLSYHLSWKKNMMPGHRCISLITGYQHYNSLSWEKTWFRSWLTSLLFFHNSHSYAWLQRCKLLLTFCRLVVDSVTCLLVLFPVKKNCSRTEKQSWLLWTLIWYSSCQALMRATVSLVTVFVLLMRYQPLWTVQRPIYILRGFIQCNIHY